MRHDKQHQFVFASLQSDFAAQVLHRLGKKSESLNTAYLVTDFESDHERLYLRSAAALHAITRLGGLFALLTPLRWIPRVLADPFYRLLARKRYAWFGKRETCRVPSEGERARILG
jgi:predicted DCC family thiol-disulfide oxidoreductase YuxK